MSIAVKQFVLGAAGSATAAGDVALAGGFLKFDLADSNVTAMVPSALRDYPISLSMIKGGVSATGVAETLRVITVTPTAANSTDYRLVLSAEKGTTFNNNLPNEVQSVFTHTTPASGGTATTIGDAFRAAINNHPYWNTRVVASGTTTLIITAKTGFPIFSVGVGANLAQALTTAGVQPIGIGATLLASGQFTDAAYGTPVSGQTYNVITFMYEVSNNGGLAGGVYERVYLYINNAANNSTLLGLLQGFLTYR
jgi:hypothetical protein